MSKINAVAGIYRQLDVHVGSIKNRCTCNENILISIAIGPNEPFIKLSLCKNNNNSIAIYRSLFDLIIPWSHMHISS